MATTSGAIRRFDRYELKYVVHVSQLAAISNDLMPNMQLDLHGDSGGSYSITNLYYDSPELHMLYSKLAGTSYRRKLRVRVYGETPGNLANVAMVEIKQRLRRTTQKRRVVLPLGEAYGLCGGEDPRAWQDAGDQAVADEVKSLVHALSLRPACVIAYRRRAFVGSSFEPGLRITLDTDLWGAAPDLELPRPDVPRYVMPRDWAILEIKVDERIPLWVCELLVKHNCQLQRVSKYCLGMVTLRQLQVPMNYWTRPDSLPTAASLPFVASEPSHAGR
jgi:SPX domain protein involved in polyphosphate accumulation